MERFAARDADEFALLVADVYEAAGVLRQLGERTASAAGQTQARWQLLSVVSAGQWTVPMAADRVGTSRQAVQRIANDLVADGLAAFLVNPRHQRSPFLAPTKKGRRALDVITRTAQRERTSLLPALADVDLVHVRDGLRRVTTAVRNELRLS